MSEPTTEHVGRGELLVIMPVFNDWDAAECLIQELNEVLGRRGDLAQILLVDDGSSVSPTSQFLNRNYSACRGIDILRLKRNLGHQRAVCIALSYLATQMSRGTIVLMDSDGEDRAHDVSRLLDRFAEENGTKIVFAERTKRSEGFVFQLFYHAYRYLHLVLVGQKVRVGNFSVIPASRLPSLAVVPELWNHYAAAVLASRQPYCTVPTVRGTRLSGNSKMNFVSLVLHGLSALAVFSDRIGARLLLASMLLMGVLCVGLLTVVLIRLTTTLAIPGWATYTAGLLFISLVQLVTLTTIFSFVTLSNRSGSAFIPARDHVHFIESLQTLWRRP